MLFYLDCTHLILYSRTFLIVAYSPEPDFGYDFIKARHRFLYLIWPCPGSGYNIIIL